MSDLIQVAQLLCVCVGGGTSHGLLTQFTEPSLGDRCHRITSVAYSHDSTEVLVSYSSQHIYLFGLKVAIFLLRCFTDRITVEHSLLQGGHKPGKPGMNMENSGNSQGILCNLR